MFVGLQCAFDSNYYPTQNMYCCSDCSKQICNDCTIKETMSVFCPNCMFEVASGSIKAEHGNCGRNCLKCPCCLSILTVNTAKDGNSFLNCGNCRWDSNLIGMVFEKPTGITKQIKALVDRSDEVEFKRLEEYYAKLVQFYKDGKVEPKFESITNSKDWKPVETVNIDQDSPRLELLVAQTGWGMTRANYDSMLPVRVLLKSKTIKKCRGCLNVLVKPDPKVGVTTFLTNQSAWFYQTKYRDKVPRLEIKSWENNSIVLQVLNLTSNATSVVINHSDTLTVKKNSPRELQPFRECWDEETDFKTDFELISNQDCKSHNLTLKVVTESKQDIISYQLNKH